jgi:hypothetical protein
MRYSRRYGRTSDGYRDYTQSCHVYYRYDKHDRYDKYDYSRDASTVYVFIGPTDEHATQDRPCVSSDTETCMYVSGRYRVKAEYWQPLANAQLLEAPLTAKNSTGKVRDSYVR